jgi:TRAP-type C4-dicarboxylate transport system permease small subunit
MKRPVRTLIQIIAVCLMIFGLLEIGLELAHHQLQVRKHVNPIKTNLWRYLIGAALPVVGIILFLGSNSLAEQLTDDIEDTEEPDDTDEAEE